ncbi:MAG: DNA repair protein RecN [Desulfobulbaceae bacterium]|nr:DNA repair protein RecN [Desulfobulbaceae bacterium]
MLCELRITNLALITELQIQFGAAFSVLTGETGAGKSIILQAINLLYGEPAKSWVRSGAEAAVVEALFDCPAENPLHAWLREQGVADAGTVLLKRVVAATGNSRYYINGALATARMVGEAAENLITIASQHDHQQLLSRSFQLDFLDAFGDLQIRRQRVGELYERWSTLRQRQEELRRQEADKEQRRDFLAFQLHEIEEAVVLEGEDERLEQEKQRLRAAGDLARLGGASYELLSGRIIDSLSEVRRNLHQMAALDVALAELAEEVAGPSYQLEEGVQRLRSYLDELTADPARLDEITGRIDVLQRLKRKYGPTLAEVSSFARSVAEELQDLDKMDRELADLDGELLAVAGELTAAGRELSGERRMAAERLAATVTAELRALCLEKAVFGVDFSEADTQADLAGIGRKGWDHPEFMFSANHGEPLKPLAKVASGGELSRLMLALKGLLARQDQVATVVFDEIDAGISGQTAEAVARKIRSLAAHHQVICITHLPQIAAAADEHFTVSKSLVSERTQTTIARLAPAERVGELARMLDGDSATAKTRAYAEELLGKNRGR